MNWQKGYYTDDLKIYLNYIENRGKPSDSKAYYSANHRYRIFILLQGDAIVHNNNKSFNLTQWQMLFTDCNASYGYTFDYSDAPVKYVEMIIHPSVLENTYDDDLFLRAMQKTPDEKRIIDLKDKKFASIRQLCEDIIKCLENDSGRAHLLPRLYSVISELDFYYDEISSKKEKVFKDNLSMTVIEYVKHHYTEKITYKNITDKFFISKPTIIKIFKAYSGRTMHDYIEFLRLEAAKNLINDNVNVVKAAKMSGFEYYSTFLRAYKNEYGRLPAEKQKKYRKYPKL